MLRLERTSILSFYAGTVVVGGAPPNCSMMSASLGESLRGVECGAGMAPGRAARTRCAPPTRRGEIIIAPDLTLIECNRVLLRAVVRKELRGGRSGRPPRAPPRGCSAAGTARSLFHGNRPGLQERLEVGQDARPASGNRFDEPRIGTRHLVFDAQLHGLAERLEIDGA